jgi:hypothetical protein
MVYRGVPNWPPAWTWRSGSTIRRVRGEIGALKEIVPSGIRPMTQFFMIMEFHNCEYMGAMLFEDASFCRQIFFLLKPYCGRPLNEIGDLELGHLL